MNLSILFIQRREDYEGQCAPEALVVWDEFSMEENPEGFDLACTAALSKQGSDVIASRVIDVAVDQAKVRAMLVGVPKIEGEVCDAQE